MTGKVIIVTGANTGIGYAAAQNLCEGGNDVILACRSEDKGKAAVEEILKKNPNALATFMQLDLADMASVRKFVDDFHETGKKLNVLINNAGLSTPEKRWTKDNFEMMMGTNHLGHFLLTNLLLDNLKNTASEAGEARIVNVASIGHDTEVKFGRKRTELLSVEDFFLDKEGAFNNMQGYKNSKLCNVLMTHSLSKQLEGSNVTCNCVCPGLVKDSQLARDNGKMKKFFLKYVVVPIVKLRKIAPVHNLEEAGRCLVDLAVKEEYKDVSGKFFSDYAEKKPSDESLDEDLQKSVYELSARYCHLSGYEQLDAPPPPKPEEKIKNKRKSKKSKEDTQIEEKEEKKEGEEGEKDVLNTTDDIKYADADTSKTEEAKKDEVEEKKTEDVEEEKKTEEKSEEKQEEEPKVDEKGDAVQTKELEPEEKEIKKTEDVIIVETQAEITAQ